MLNVRVIPGSDTVLQPVNPAGYSTYGVAIGYYETDRWPVQSMAGRFEETRSAAPVPRFTLMETCETAHVDVAAAERNPGFLWQFDKTCNISWLCCGYYMFRLL
jgi:hypothetical protein